MAKLTPEKREMFAAELREGQSVSAAATAISVSRAAVYKLRAQDETFRHLWDDAIESGTDALEDEAVKRAKNGSDTLLIFMLKGRRPDRYRERVTVDVNKLDSDIERELAVIASRSESPITGEVEGETVH